jgi:tetratricopeptide (TPR) repeat protein
MSGLKLYSISLVLTIFFLFFSSVTGQDTSQLLNEEEQEKILNKISQLLIDNYVIKDVGQACADFLEEKIEDESYADITHPRAFTRELNSDLRKIHNDQHIRIQSIPPEDKRLKKNPRLDFFLRTRDKIKENMGFKEAKIMPGNVGYINIYSFEPYELAREKALMTLRFVENADALIIDLRNNLGGNPTMVQFLCSYFFDQPLHLNSIFWRRGDYTEEFWSMDSIGIKKRPKVPVFILTSERTFSGGEEFAFNLKTNKRATLIGEKTAGGANPGYTFRINDFFNIFIPTGRSINPITGTNWEGTGVEPDITIERAKALPLALEKAEHAARIYREKIDDQVVMSYLQLCTDFDMMDTLLARGDTDSALSIIDRALHNAVNSELLNEWMINDLGYRYLAKNNFSSALALFHFNGNQYPGSFNVYDSLGEVYMKSGEKEMAIKNYKKSLELNPRNENAKHMLKKLRTEIDHGLRR